MGSTSLGVVAARTPQVSGDPGTARRQGLLLPLLGGAFGGQPLRQLRSDGLVQLPRRGRQRTDRRPWPPVARRGPLRPGRAPVPPRPCPGQAAHAALQPLLRPADDRSPERAAPRRRAPFARLPQGGEHQRLQSPLRELPAASNPQPPPQGVALPAQRRADCRTDAGLRGKEALLSQLRRALFVPDHPPRAGDHPRDPSRRFHRRFHQRPGDRQRRQARGRPAGRRHAGLPRRNLPGNGPEVPARHRLRPRTPEHDRPDRLPRRQGPLAAEDRLEVSPLPLDRAAKAPSPCDRNGPAGRCRRNPL